MTYLELKQEVDKLQKQCADQEINVTVVSDMPLQPWFDLYLAKFWAEKGRKASIKRILWQERNLLEEGNAEVIIYWPSSETAAEINLETERRGIWIGSEKVSDPMELFYPAIINKKEMTSYPAGSQVIDLEKLMLRLGISQSLAEKEKRWGDRYSAMLQEAVAREAVRVYELQHGRRKKCLVLDCDGVLWGGIISEDSLLGIVLSETGKGQLYQRFQLLAQRLNRHGIILAICSKNDEDDVQKVFCSHTAMKLQSDDIAAWSVSWEPKSQQIAKLAEKLQIDLRDMVLVDDSLWELEEVRSQHPQVACVLFDLAQGERQIYETLSEYFLLQPEDENLQNRLRLQTYADNAKREELKQSTGSYEEFLEKLGTKVEVRSATESDLARISDLSRRANQCTNGTRYSPEDLQRLLEEGYQLQGVFISDIYRDLGLVGCIGIDQKERCLDLFCLSCRALGRRVEHQLLAALPPEIVKIRWQDTGKNARLLDLIRQEGRWQL